jgi:hypothetical protein
MKTARVVGTDRVIGIAINEDGKFVYNIATKEGDVKHNMLLADTEQQYALAMMNFFEHHTRWSDDGKRLEIIGMPMNE